MSLDQHIDKKEISSEHDSVAWRVGREKQRVHEAEVDRILSLRPRLRRDVSPN